MISVAISSSNFEALKDCIESNNNEILVTLFDSYDNKSYDNKCIYLKNY